MVTCTPLFSPRSLALNLVATSPWTPLIPTFCQPSTLHICSHLPIKRLLSLPTSAWDKLLQADTCSRLLLEMSIILVCRCRLMLRFLRYVQMLLLCGWERYWQEHRPSRQYPNCLARILDLQDGSCEWQDGCCCQQCSCLRRARCQSCGCQFFPIFASWTPTGTICKSLSKTMMR